MKKYSFKSSGTKFSDAQAKRSDSVNNYTLPPLSIKTPLELSNDGESSLFNMHYEITYMIHNNLKNMLLTNNGERLGRYDYGASLRELTFEMINSPDYENIVMQRIKNSVDKYMPFIDLESFSSEKVEIEGRDEHSSLVKVNVLVTYNIPKIRVINKTLEINLYVGG